MHDRTADGPGLRPRLSRSRAPRGRAAPSARDRPAARPERGGPAMRRRSRRVARALILRGGDRSIEVDPLPADWPGPWGTIDLDALDLPADRRSRVAGLAGRPGRHGGRLRGGPGGPVDLSPGLGRRPDHAADRGTTRSVWRRRRLADAGPGRRLGLDPAGHQRPPRRQAADRLPPMPPGRRRFPGRVRRRGSPGRGRPEQSPGPLGRRVGPGDRSACSPRRSGTCETTTRLWARSPSAARCWPAMPRSGRRSTIGRRSRPAGPAHRHRRAPRGAVPLSGPG